MKKSTYLIILFLLSFGYFTYLLRFEKAEDFLLLATWFWGVVGFVKYHKHRKNRLNVLSNKKYVYWFLILMVISTLYPYFIYNQSIISTLMAQRANYSVLALLLFLYMHPSEKDFFIALRFCSYLCIAIMLISIVFPSFFIAEERLDYLLLTQSEGSTDLVTATNGARLMIFYFFIQTSRLLNHANTKSIIEVIFLMLMLVLLQNRSTLIIAVPVFLYAFMKIRTKRKVLYWFLGIVVLSVFSGYIIKSAIVLWEESAQQLGNTDYNRWQAISFFLIESKSNFFTVFFGHGISASGSPYLDILLAAQEERLAYISDIGFLGSYYLYGILFIGIIYFFAFKALKKKQPHYLKFYALFVILVPWKGKN